MSAVESSALPPLYAGWMQDCLGASIPGEAPSTCSDCAMCSSSGAPTGSNLYYSPSTKCCTYLPRMWNFLAGRVLTDDSPEARRGRATLETRLDAGLAVTPLGLEQTRLFVHLYSQGRHSFGKTKSLLCPHYLDEGGGLCGVWRHRESTCATWFCKHERGRVGERFFESLHWLLSAAELALAHWAVLELDIGEEALELLVPPPNPLPKPMSAAEFEGVPDQALRKRQWGRWAGRERAFYTEAARLVGMLKWADIRTIAGPELQIHERIVRENFRRLEDRSIPERLLGQEMRIEEQGPHTTRVGTYSHLDPLSLPNELVAVLRYFDGSETSGVLETIEEEARLRLEPELILRLADFGILKAAGQS